MNIVKNLVEVFSYVVLYKELASHKIIVTQSSFFHQSPTEIVVQLKPKKKNETYGVLSNNGFSLFFESDK